MITRDKIQEEFFNKSNNQYQYHLLVHPQKHVQNELDTIRAHIPLKCHKIVDFGSGTGRLSVYLLKQGFQVTAVDISQTSLEKLSMQVNELNLQKRFKCLTSLVKNEVYELIAGTDILHHLPLQEYIPYFYSHLKKGGKVIFSEPNPLNISWILFISLFLNWKIEKGILECTKFNIQRILRKTGFQDIRIYGHGLLPPQIFTHFPFLSSINYWLGNVPFLNIFAYRLIITGEK